MIGPYPRVTWVNREVQQASYDGSGGVCAAPHGYRRLEATINHWISGVVIGR